MTFLHWGNLLGLAAVAIPIVIHLLNRQQAKTVAWGATRFLLASLASRNRRILIEEVILMGLRCGLLTLLVLAMARPFLPVRWNVPWLLVLPAAVASGLCAAIAAAMWSDTRSRWKFLAAAAALMIGAMLATAWEQLLQKRQWGGEPSAQDIVLILDASDSMTLEVDPEKKQTNFDRAVEEARAVVAACRPADSVAILLGGPKTRSVLGHLSSDRAAAQEALRDLSVLGGSADMADALTVAGGILERGRNGLKRIVIFTDGQAIGWDLENRARWTAVATALEAQATPATRIICRTLGLPKEVRNLALTDLRFSRQVVGTDRPVRLDVTVTNAGTEPSPVATVQMTTASGTLATQVTSPLKPGASETLSFPHRFEKPTQQVVAAALLGQDAVARDNQIVRVVPVVDRLPILIVDGAPSLVPWQGAADYLRAALWPGDEQPAQGHTKPAPTDAEGEGGISRALVEATTVAAVDLAGLSDFSRYRAIVLCDVPRLPDALARRLLDYVRSGGGVWFALGSRVDPDFYNAWRTWAGQPLLPGKLVERRNLGEEPVHLSRRSFAHPALQQASDTRYSDAEKVLFRSYWRLDPEAGDRDVQIGALLENGDPWLVQRRLGNGTILVSACGFDDRDSTLPQKDCFVYIAHEAVYALASAVLPPCNFPTASPVALELTGTGTHGVKKGQSLTVEGPDGTTPRATVSGLEPRVAIQVSGAEPPGLYHVDLTKDDESVPFVVFAPARESLLEELSDEDFSTIARAVPLERSRDGRETLAFLFGGVPGEELWKYLALGVLLAAVSEILLTRWIAIQRHGQASQPIVFGGHGETAQEFRARARDMLRTPTGTST